jgi:hypothetical protein
MRQRRRILTNVAGTANGGVSEMRGSRRFCGATYGPGLATHKGAEVPRLDVNRAVRGRRSVAKPWGVFGHTSLVGGGAEMPGSNRFCGATYGPASLPDDCSGLRALLRRLRRARQVVRGVDERDVREGLREVAHHPMASRVALLW